MAGRWFVGLTVHSHSQFRCPLAIKPMTDPTHSRLLSRCEELGLTACVGDRDELEKRLLDEERRLASRQRVVAQSRTIELPLELIQHEITSYLNVKDLLAYCETNNAARTLCDEGRLLEERAKVADYNTLKQNVLDWFWSGIQIDKLLRVLPEIVDRLDLHTLQYGYFYLLEHQKEREALRLREIVKEAPNHKKRMDGNNLWLSQKGEIYEQARILIEAIRGDDDRKRIVAYFELTADDLDMQTSIGAKYGSELLISALNDAEIELLLRAFVNGDRMNSLSLLHFCTELKARNRFPFLLTLLVSNLMLNINNMRLYTPRELNLYGQDYRAQVLNPLTREGILEHMSIGFVTPTSPLYLTPQEFVDKLVGSPKQIIHRLLRSVGLNIAKIVNGGYSAWAEEVVRLMEKKKEVHKDKIMAIRALMDQE